MPQWHKKGLETKGGGNFRKAQDKRRLQAGAVETDAAACRNRQKGGNMEYLELGNVVRDLDPDMQAGNPRNSEGTFLETEKDGIVFIYSRFRGQNPADHAYADLCMMRSMDGGRTFDQGTVILTCEGEDGVNMMSPSLLKMQNGDVGLFYLVRVTYDITKIFLRRSADGGRTWGDRVCCTPHDDFFVMNNDRVLRLSSGRIVVPVADIDTFLIDAGFNEGD